MTGGRHDKKEELPRARESFGGGEKIHSFRKGLWERLGLQFPYSVLERTRLGEVHPPRESEVLHLLLGVPSKRRRRADMQLGKRSGAGIPRKRQR